MKSSYNGKFDILWLPSKQKNYFKQQTKYDITLHMEWKLDFIWQLPQTNIIHGLGIRFLFGNCLKSVKINPDGHCLDGLDCKKMDSWDLGDFIMPFLFSLDISWYISWLLQHSLRTALWLFYASYYCSCCERGPSVWGDEDNCLLWFWLSHFPGPQIERVWLPRLLLSSW